MNWGSVTGRMLKFAIFLFAAGALYAMLRGAGLYNFTDIEAEGLDTLILLIGSIYSVVFAFVIFVIWGQFTEVENLVLRECNALNDVLRFGLYLSADAARPLRRVVEDYARWVVSSEWQSLADRHKDQQTEQAFTKLMNTVVRTTPASPIEDSIHQRLIDIARKAGEHRDERIAKSLTRIPPTLLRLVNTLAGAMLTLVFVYPFHHWVTGMSCFTLLSLILVLAHLVMTDTDNPFKGVCNVSPDGFSELIR